jgi:inositol hexakisphosphate/diphosphoinositol-pentakisphosphate kinase
MYESRNVPIDSPDRFRIEILFSPGANYNPFEVSIEEDHTLPPVPRVHMEEKEV